MKAGTKVSVQENPKQARTSNMRSDSRVLDTKCKTQTARIIKNSKAGFNKTLSDIYKARTKGAWSSKV